MSEIQVISSNEQRLAPDEMFAAEAVFNGVYKSFADVAKNSPTEQNRYIDGEVKKVTVNPAHEFVRERFVEAGKTIEPLANQPVSPADVSEKFISEATIEAKIVYDDNSVAVGVRVERAKRVVYGFIDRASALFAAGETDGLTTKLFFDQLKGIKYGLSLGYNKLVAKNDEPKPSKETQHKYAQAVHDMLVGKPNIEEQHNRGFLHINGQRYQASDSSTNERYYISPKLNGQPEEVVRAWIETLGSLGLGDKIYYKVAEQLLLPLSPPRYDSLIAYVASGTADEIQRAVQEFARRCPPELLSDTIIPTGVAVAKGIARAPEPDELNALLRYRGKEKVSYNLFACALTELALRRASFEFIKQGARPAQVTPKALAAAAKPYFVQFVRLSGIDPATMKPAA